MVEAKTRPTRWNVLHHGLFDPGRWQWERSGRAKARVGTRRTDGSGSSHESRVGTENRINRAMTRTSDKLLHTQEAFGSSPNAPTTLPRPLVSPPRPDLSTFAPRRFHVLSRYFRFRSSNRTDRASGSHAGRCQNYRLGSRPTFGFSSQTGGRDPIFTRFSGHRGAPRPRLTNFLTVLPYARMRHNPSRRVSGHGAAGRSRRERSAQR